MTHDSPTLESDSASSPSLMNAVDRLMPVLEPHIDSQTADGIAEPSGEVRTSPRAPQPTAFRDEARPYVLVVDDDAINYDLIESALETNYEVLFAKDGTSALKISGERVPDLILLDVMMPGIDGYEVCRQLKAQLRTANVPVIFMTALRNRTFVIAALEAGAVGFVLKPIDARSVRARVNKQLRLNAA